MTKSLCVIGGGAAGMACAIEALRSGVHVTIMEHKERIGKKILMTGNGKCNFTNRNLQSNMYYSNDLAFVSRVLAKMDTDQMLSFFSSLQLCYKEKNGYYYPVSNQASSVLDVMRFALEKMGCDIILSCSVKQIKPNQNHYDVITNQGIYQFDAVVLACGGKSYAETGSDGSGYTLAKSLGLQLLKPAPALGGLRSFETYFKRVSGVRTDGKVSIYVDGKLLGEDAGEIQLTDYGISGIPVFQVSRIVARTLCDQTQADIVAKLDLFPEISYEQLCRALEKRFKVQAGLTAEQALSGFLNKKINSLFLTFVEIKSGDDAADVSQKKIKRLASYCKSWEIPIKETNDFSKSQVCSGGVLLSQLSDSFEVKNRSGLYVIGELTDVDGKCGGYNLHWAFASGIIAAKDIAEA